MTPDSFEPPKSRSNEASAPPGSPYRAVAIGYLVDVGGSLAVSFLLSFAYAVGSLSAGRNAEEIDIALSGSDALSWIYVVEVLAGAAMSVLGGYVCARIARRDDSRPGLLLAALSVGTGILMTGAKGDWARNLWFGAATVGCVLLGTYLGIRSNRRN